MVHITGVCMLAELGVHTLIPPSAASERETGLESLLRAPRQYTVCRCSWL